MKSWDLIFFILVFFSSCDKKAQKNVLQNGGITISPVDSSKNVLISSKDFTGVILDTSINSEPKGFTPTSSEIVEAEKIFNKCLYVDKIGSDSMKIKVESLKAPNLYYRQYSGYINEKGHKTIAFNCFTKEAAKNWWGEGWKRKEYSVKDGGNDFFRIVINLETNDCAYFSVNGEA